MLEDDIVEELEGKEWWDGFVADLKEELQTGEFGGGESEVCLWSEEEEDFQLEAGGEWK